MDWAKAKTILIVILLLLNIVLGFMYFNVDRDKSPYTASDKVIEELKTRLHDYGIELDTEIPKDSKPMGTLSVHYEEGNPMELNRKFFGREGVIENQPNMSIVNYGNETITIINNRRLLYENLNVPGIGVIPMEEARDIALNFLQEKELSVDDLYLVGVESSGSTHTFSFTKIYKDFLVETSYTEIVVYFNQVAKMDRLWINVTDETKPSIEIEPAFKALFSLIGEQDFVGDKIIGINQCYYFNPEEQGILEDNTRAERGRAIPAWRIAFESGRVKVVDNY